MTMGKMHIGVLFSVGVIYCGVMWPNLAVVEHHARFD